MRNCDISKTHLKERFGFVLYNLRRFTITTGYCICKKAIYVKISIDLIIIYQLKKHVFFAESNQIIVITELLITTLKYLVYNINNYYLNYLNSKNIL